MNEKEAIEFIISLFASPIIEDAYSELKDKVTGKRKDEILISEVNEELEFIVDAEFDDFQTRLSEHIKENNKWSQSIKIQNKTKKITDGFVKMKFFINQRKTHFEKEEPLKFEMNQILEYSENVVIYGQPGAGKSTSMKFLCQEIITSKTLTTPIVIRFRELNPKWGQKWSDNLSISKKILEILGINLVNVKTKDNTNLTFSDYQRFAINSLNYLKVTLILDGFDEISSEEQKEFISGEIRKLSLNLSQSKFILTSRTGDFDLLLDNTKVYEISPLKKEQIKEFIETWIDNPNQAADLHSQIMNSPIRDTAERPLTLGHLCSIYDKSVHKKIPEKPKSIYRLIIQMLLKEWNESRGIKRTSNYANFEVDRKEEFLYNLAFLLTAKYNAIEFNKAILKDVYKTLANSFNLPLSEVDTVLSELESHNGIFIQTGFDTYEFSHLSLQEYLTARYIVSLGTTPNSIEVLNRIPNSLAIATVISANQTQYFYNLIFNNLLKSNISSKFLTSFFERLINERPDFSINPILGVSLLVLLEKNIRAINKENKSNRDENIASFKSLEEDFYQVFEYDVIKKSLKRVSEYYKMKDEVFVTKYNIAEYFFTIKKIKPLKDQFNNYSTPLQITLPKWTYNYIKE